MRASLPSRNHERADPPIRADLSAVRLRQAGNDAHRRLPVLLRMHPVRGVAQAQPRRLLRFLLVRLGQVPADAGAALLLRLAGSGTRFPGREKWARLTIS